MDALRADVSRWLDLEALSRLLAAPPDWVVERVRSGLVEVQSHADGAPAHWRFDSLVVARLRSMRRTEAAFGAAPELAALVADLEEEVARLRALLSVLGR
jgi:chaperone modulatory protein CbpM